MHQAKGHTVVLYSILETFFKFCITPNNVTKTFQEKIKMYPNDMLQATVLEKQNMDPMIIKTLMLKEHVKCLNKIVQYNVRVQESNTDFTYVSE